MTRTAATGALFVLCAIGALPYLSLLHTGPAALDSAEWIARGAIFEPTWREWVFETRHFGVGYRPITALSFTINQAIGGFEPAAFRSVDISLHLLGGILAYHLFCALSLADERRKVGGLVAAALFLAHPTAQDVLPILARRSYLLANVFGMAGLWALARSVAKGSSAAARLTGATASGVLLAAALFSNESSAMSIVVVPGVAAVALRRLDWREVFAASSIPLGIAGFAVAVRLALVGGAGGYALNQPLSERIGPVAAATWRSLGGGDPAWAALEIFLLLLLALGLWRFVQAARNPTSNGHPVVLLGVLWLVGTTLLYASQGVWYPRQGYLLLAPFALLVAQLIASSTTWTARTPWLVLCALLFSTSPTVCGLDETIHARLAARQERMEWLADALTAISAPATVHLVIPFTRGDGPVTPLRADVPHELHRDYFTASVWLSAVRRADGIRVRNFLFYETDGGRTQHDPTPLVNGSGEIQLRGRAYLADGSSRLIDVPSMNTVPIPRAQDGDEEYLLIQAPNSTSLSEL